MRKEMTLTGREIFTIRLHKQFARLLYIDERLMRTGKYIFLLFSRKAKAMDLMKTGERFEVQGETERAIEYFEKALKKYPKLADVHLNLCRSYLRQLAPEKAKEHGMLILQKHPDSPEANLYMGVIFYYEGRPEDALVYLKKAERFLPSRDKKSASALEYMGECYLKLQRYDDAVGCLEKSIAANPYGGEKKYISLGEGYYLLDRKEEALGTFKKALELNPGNYEAWNNIGVLMWSVNKMEDAYKCFKKALDIKPDYKEAQANIDQIQSSLKPIKGNGINKVKYGMFRS